MATLDDIRQRLIDQSVTGTIALGSMPSDPDSVVVLRATGGYSPQHTFGTDNAVRRPTIQVVARAGQEDYEAAQTKAEQCYQALFSKAATINSVRYMRIETEQSEPFLIRQDENGRWEIGFNILCHKG